MFLVIINLMPYFILTQYSLFEDRVEVRYLFLKISRKYEEFGCFYHDKHGIMLSTFKVPRRLDSFRGLSLRFSKSRIEVPELLKFLGTKISKQY
ncbi:MAG: hypothetical protein PHI68_07080 [Candidatus Cloacimonetes bacterium]|nr:hypothetical protein [Candidatus Cloacimonadota bacterium]